MQSGGYGKNRIENEEKRIHPRNERSADSR
jgi:hypothetical protein